MALIGEIGEAILPWFMTGDSLGAGEAEELAKRQAMPITLTKKESTMAGGAGQTLITAARKAAEYAKDPAVRAKLGEYYTKATGKTADFTNSAVVSSIVNKGPAPAAVVLRGLVTAGVNPDRIFDGILQEQADGASARVIAELRTTYASIRSKLDSASVIHADGGLAEQLLRKDIILFARDKLGSVKAIREYHAKMRVFLAMDTAAVESQIALHLN